MVNMYFNFELSYFCLSIHLFLFVHNHCERTAAPAGMKFGISTRGGCDMVTIKFGRFLVYLFFYLYITTGIERTNGLIRIKFGMSILRWGME